MERWRESDGAQFRGPRNVHTGNPTQPKGQRPPAREPYPLFVFTISYSFTASRPLYCALFKMVM